MAKSCCVCGDLKESPENRLFRCGGQGCGITVHQACYGIVTIPSGLWFCRKCESQERAARVKCELCPRKDGALKRTDSGTWAHVVCALYIPEVTFGNLRTMEPIITSKLPRERFTKICYICESQGQENQASTGACMSCHRSNCRLSFHVTCAQKEQLLVEEQDPRDSRNIIYCGYCGPHYKRMKKQKLKKQHNQSSGSHHSGGGVVSMGSIGGGGGSVGVGGVSMGPSSVSNSIDLPVAGASNSHPHPSADSITQPNNMYMAHAGGGAYHHGNKQLTKIKTEGERLSKRSSCDVGLLPSAKRKYRRRKLSSSNESTSSESLSLASEPLTHHTVPSSPSITASTSPNVFHSDTKKIGNEDSVPPSAGPETHTNTNDMDCGNLDLLASVTQRIDKFDRVSNEVLSPIATTSSIDHAPIVKTRGSPLPPPVSMMDSKEGIKRNSTVSRSSSGCGKKRKTAVNTTSSNTNQQQPRPSSNSFQLNPPTTLQELLERQWEQTAQFILDQAGKQNNAGVMLAHLHELQSENRSMQSRIMELASQREFFIATNSRLRQTLTEGGASSTVVVSKGMNGMQMVPPSTNQQAPPPISNHAHHNYHRSIDSGSLSYPVRSPGNHQHVVVVTESQQTTGGKGNSNFMPVSCSSVINTTPQSPTSELTNTTISSDPVLGHTHKINSRGDSPMSTYRHTPEATPTTNHEVTHVTNSVQGPIATFTGFPDNHAGFTDNHAPYSSHQLFSPYSHRHST